MKPIPARTVLLAAIQLALAQAAVAQAQVAAADAKAVPKATESISIDLTSRSEEYDLSALPAYEPGYAVTEFEPIRLYGSGLNGLVDALCEGFRKYQTKARFENRFPS